jgi:hypothetical protein
METTFESMYRNRIEGKLTAIDRLIIHGHLQAFWHEGAFATFLRRQGFSPGEFGRYVGLATERIKAHAKKIAQKAGRPWQHFRKTVKGKDDLARQIAQQDGITEGLICVFSALELATCFALERGAIRPTQRKCLHFYFYLIDRELGFIHVRLQSWFPFQIQIYINGREWLSRQLDKRGLGYERYENTFLHLEDLKATEALVAGFAKRKWSRTFDVFARRVNPLLRLIRRLDFGDYYWTIDECEVATDLMFHDRQSLVEILPDLFDHANRAFSADDVVFFLGQKRLPRKAELVSKYRHTRRPYCRRIKHRIRRNWIKMYDKWSVLRIETVINNPRDFRVLRFKTVKRGKRRGHWVPMNKGIGNLWRYIQIGEGANHRYLEGLSAVRPTGRALAELDAVSRSRETQGKRYGRFNPVGASDRALFEAVMAGEHSIAGFRNKDLRARLFLTPPRSAAETDRRRARTSRLIRKLRGHGLVAKVPGSRLYRVTPRGHRVMSAAIEFTRLALAQREPAAA